MGRLSKQLLKSVFAKVNSKLALREKNGVMPYDAEVEYLESTGTQYISLPEYNLGNNTVVELSLGATVTSGDIKMFGGYPTFLVAEYSGKWRTFQHHWELTDIVVADNIDVVVRSTKNYVYFYKTGILLKSLELLRGNATLAPIVGGIDNKGTILKGKARYRYIRFYEGSTIVHDYVPIRVGQTGYLFDRVSKQLFGNVGTGSFILGPDKHVVSPLSAAPFNSYGAIVRDMQFPGEDVTLGDIGNNLSTMTISIPEGTTKIGTDSFSNFEGVPCFLEVPDSVVQCDKSAFDESHNIKIAKAPVIFKDIDTGLAPVLEYTTSGQANGTYLSTDANGVTWQYTVANEMATITKLSAGCPNDLVIPAFFGTTPVRRLGEKALAGQPMYSLKIPNSITAFAGTNVCSGCVNLSSIDIPDSISEMSGITFAHCTNLLSASIPGTILNLGASTFNHCDNLQSLKLGEGINGQKAATFAYSGLPSIVMPNSYTGENDIGFNAFLQCANLVSFQADSCTTLACARTFAACQKLVNIIVPKLKTLGTVFGTSAAHASSTDKLSSLVSLSLPSIETIASKAFGYSATQQYTNITELFIPNKPYREIVKMANYATWYLGSGCIIHARDRDFYYGT